MHFNLRIEIYKKKIKILNILTLTFKMLSMFLEICQERFEALFFRKSFDSRTLPGNIV